MASIEQVTKQLAADDQVQVYKARQELVLRTAEAGAPGKDSLRSAVAAEMLKPVAIQKEEKDKKGKLTKVPEMSAKGRSLAYRYLANVAGASEVPALEAALQDFEVREMARWALARMTCQAATDALAKAALTAIGDEFRVGTINALAGRSGSNVREALVKCAASFNNEIRLAAVEALAGDPEASNDEVMVKAARGGFRAAKRLARARLRLAENLAAAGNKPAARQIYEQIAAGEYEPAQQKAALAALDRLA